MVEEEFGLEPGAAEKLLAGQVTGGPKGR